MTMAHSLEARSPFLDHKLVEFATQLPAEFKIRNFTGKYILRKIMRDKLPEEIINRKKHGFLVPLDKWLDNQLKDYARSILMDQSNFSASIIGARKIEELFKPAFGLKGLERKVILWRLLVFELWKKSF